MCAVEKGNADFARVLLKAGADKDAQDEVRIGVFQFFAIVFTIRNFSAHVMCDDHDVCAYAWGGGYSFATHTHAQREWTALIHAARNGRVDCARLLVDVGADKTLKDNVRLCHCITAILLHLFQNPGECM